MYKPLFVSLLITIFSVFSTHAAVYKWVDENGETHYGSQRPADAQAERMKVKVRSPEPQDETEDGQEGETGDKAGVKEGEQDQKQPETAPAAKPEPPKLPAKEKRRLCKDARSRLDVYQTNSRIRDKNRAYLSEKERQKRMAQIKKDIRKYCR